MPPMKDRLVDIYKKGETLSEKHQRQLWNIYLTMDTSVGVIHNDSNCLNIMTDMKNNIKLIDFDRSAVVEKKHIVKYGPYVNLDFMNLLGCFTKYSINPGKILMKKYCDLFNQCVIPTKNTMVVYVFRYSLPVNQHGMEILPLTLKLSYFISS